MHAYVNECWVFTTTSNCWIQSRVVDCISLLDYMMLSFIKSGVMSHMHHHIESGTTLFTLACGGPPMVSQSHWGLLSTAR